MNFKDYNQKLETMLKTNDYAELKKDTSEKAEKEIRKIVNRELKNKTKTRFHYHHMLSPSFSTPYLYALPKLHKKDHPMRTIVSARNGPCNNLAKYLVNIFNPLVETYDKRLKNSSQLVDDLRDFKLEPTDVVSLFPSVPIMEVLDILKIRLESDDNSKERTKLAYKR